MAIFEITMLFLGSIIGAGFATGAEIVTFFNKWQIPIWLIAVIVGACIYLLITLDILLFYPKPTFNIKTKSLNNKPLHIVIIMIYLILFTAMTAGIAQITNSIICSISLVFSATITLLGIQKLSRFNIVIVATIIILIISTAVPYAKPITPTPNWQHITPVTFWAILYAGLNCFMFPELIKAYSKTQKRKTLLTAGFITATLVAILFYLIFTTLKSKNATTAMIPLLTAVPTTTTFIIILLAVLTSQYTALFAIVERLNIINPKTKNRPLVTAVCLCLIAFLGSFSGFTRIIQYGYPLIGAFTCFYLLFSFLQQSWQVSRRK